MLKIATKFHVKHRGRKSKRQIAIEDKIFFSIGFFIISITIFCITIFFCLVFPKEKNYEYAKDGNIYESKDCFLKDGIGYCEKDNNYIEVDNYYEKE